MTGVHIRTRELKDGGKSYVVRYRLGGRGYPLRHAGSFRTLKDARTRRDLVAGELAAGRDPQLAIHALQNAQPAQTVEQTARDWICAFKAQRTAKAATGAQYEAMVPTAIRGLEQLTVADVGWERLQRWITDNATLAPATLRQCRTIHRHVFDHAGVDPNPARDRRLKLPRETHAEPQPPPSEHVEAILGRVAARLVLPFAVLEQTGMRVNELSVTWGDVDEAGSRFRLRASETKTARARWVQLPEWLMRAVSDSCPREDRVPDRRVFPGVTDDQLRHAMRRACQAAGIPHYHPHDLRHRRITLWHHAGVPWKAVAERVGQSRASVTIDTYTHAMPLGELPDATWERLLVRHP